MFYLPELGLGANLVSCPELHAVDLRVLFWFRRESPPNDLVLVILQSQKRKTSLSKNHSQSKTKSSTDSRWSFSHPERNHFFVRRWPNALSLSTSPSLSESRCWARGKSMKGFGYIWRRNPSFFGLFFYLGWTIPAQMYGYFSFLFSAPCYFKKNLVGWPKKTSCRPKKTSFNTRVLLIFYILF